MNRWPARPAMLLLAVALAAQQASRSLLASLDLQMPGAASWTLPLRLREVSGLVADGTQLLAHDDERAIVYQIDAATAKIARELSFGPLGGVRGDFEGITLAGDHLFLVTSDGRLLESAAWRTGKDVAFTEHRTGAGDRCEIEGLAYDSTTREMRLACKATRPVERPTVLTILRWSLDRRALVDPPIAIPLGSALHPSDIARDPVTGNWVVVAAREATLVEITADGRIVSTVRLPRPRHRQAEGLAVTREKVFVADEGGGKAPGIITAYRRK